MIRYDPHDPHDPHDPANGRREVMVQPARTISREEYLVFERAAETKHEFHDGHVYAMTGASLRHNRIVVNLIATLHAATRGGPCSVLGSDMRLHVRASGLYTYPDLTMVCGEPELEDEYLDTLLNPMTLIEVVSPSTERYDRGRKAEHYRTIETLREYLLVSQDQARMELYSRAGDRQWTLSEAIGLGDSIALYGIDRALPLAEVYAGVDFR